MVLEKFTVYLDQLRQPWYRRRKHHLDIMLQVGMTMKESHVQIRIHSHDTEEVVCIHQAFFVFDLRCQNRISEILRTMFVSKTLCVVENTFERSQELQVSKKHRSAFRAHESNTVVAGAPAGLQRVVESSPHLSTTTHTPTTVPSVGM